MAKITEEKLNSDESFGKFFTEIQENTGRFLYPYRSQKSAKYVPCYALQIVEYAPSADGTECKPLNECVIPMYFDAEGNFCLTHELLDYYTVTGNGKEWFLETNEGDVPYANPWKFVTYEQNVNLEEGRYPSLLVKMDFTSEKYNYVRFRVFGGLRPDLDWVKGLPEYPQLTSKQRKSYFDFASRVVLYDGSRPRYSYVDGLYADDWSSMIGHGDCFYLYQYKRPDPEECGGKFNADTVKNYSQTQSYGLGKKYIKFKIVENTENVEEQG